MNGRSTDCAAGRCTVSFDFHERMVGYDMFVQVGALGFCFGQAASMVGVYVVVAVGSATVEIDSQAVVGWIVHEADDGRLGRGANRLFGETWDHLHAPA